MLNGEWAQPASNTHYLTLGPEEPAVTNQLGSALLEITVAAAGHTPTHVHPLLSCLRNSHRPVFWSQSLGIAQGLPGNTKDYTRHVS